MFDIKLERYAKESLKTQTISLSCRDIESAVQEVLNAVGNTNQHYSKWRLVYAVEMEDEYYAEF